MLLCGHIKEVRMVCEMMAFGLIGIFLGPTILAVGYTLLGAWMAEGDADAV
jgi:predicted PurR-regulated permease PerM